MDAFASLLVSEGIISAEQLAEAMRIAQSSGGWATRRASG
jgi:hypothetical protein